MANLGTKAVSTVLSFTIVSGTFSSAATAGCNPGLSAGGGAPSISATEVSTSQALELIRRRRDEAIAFSPANPPVVPASAPVTAQPAPKPAPVQAAAAQPAPPASAAATAAPKPAASPAASSAAPSAPKAKADTSKAVASSQTKAPVAPAKVASKPQPAAEPAPVKAKVASYDDKALGSYGSLKDDVVEAAPDRTRGAWVSGFYEYERQKGLTLDGGTPGQLTSTEHTAGVLAGGDKAFRSGGATVLAGLLGGYINSETSYNNVAFRTPNGDRFQATNSRDESDGGSVGAYGAYIRGNVFADLLFKADFMSLKQADTIFEDPTCAGPAEPIRRVNKADSTDLTLAGNIAQRFDLGSTSWYEPVAGFRYTHTEFGSVSQQASVVANNIPVKQFGLTDGDIVRLQGGVRVGRAVALPNDRVWVTTLAGLVYSDVLIDGISKDYENVVEGKVRALGQLTNTVSGGDGLTLFSQLDLSGGDDYIGFGAKGGLRVEW